MATLIPSLNSCLSRMTPGEKRFARRLEAKLEDDYLLWYDVPVGTTGFHPDFIIMHPRRGLLILEVKDWKLDSIRRMDKARASILTNTGIKEIYNPLEQARIYAHEVTNLLEKDPALINRNNRAHQGKLLFPWSYGVVLTNINRNQFESTDLSEVLPPHRVICQDEMSEDIEPEAFQQRLWEMFPWHFGSVLALPQIDRIRWHLFPEIRIAEPQQAGLFDDEQVQTVPDLIRIMDLQQEQLARSLGEGHRIIHGVAGSGKTMILGYRCLHLAERTKKPILVLCYNVALATRLEALMREKGLESQITIRNFHRWCRDQLTHYHVPLPPSGNDFFEQLVQQVIRAVDRGQIPAGQYGAVLIDEGHDFQPEWLNLVAQMVDPETSSLLLLYDDAQSIYGKGRRKFSFKSVGIQAQGRTTILRLNYRNTSEVLKVAYEFAKDILTPEEADEDEIPLILPESAERHGPQPELIKLPNFNREIEYITGRFKELNTEGVHWGEMAVVYRNYFMGKEATHRLRSQSIPVDWLQESKASRHYRSDEDSVKVITLHSSKGLEFPVVAIPGLGFLPYEDSDLQDEVRLMYVGMTRAMDRLIMTFHSNSDFVGRMMDVLENRVA